MSNLSGVWAILIAALGGAAVGMERQHSGHAKAHLGGIRTLALLGGLAGVAGVLWTLQMAVLSAILLGGAVGLVITGYIAASRKDIDATTEAATLVVIAAGFLSGIGNWALASGMIAVTAVLLAEKSTLHRWSERLPDIGLRSGFRFAVMALVILPLLPEGPYGPGNTIRPRALWMIVLLLSGINFLGYAARLIVGPGRGAVWTGLLGGLISSTNVMLNFSRKSRQGLPGGHSLAGGAIASNTVMFLRVVVVSFALNPRLSLAVLPYLLPPLLAGAALTWWGLRRKLEESFEIEAPKNPLEVWEALKMAVLFQGVLFVVEAVRGQWGAAGLIPSGAVLGLTDVDALTISMAKAADDTKENALTAALALAVGCSANTVFKGAVALVIGRGEFRRSASLGTLVLLAAAGLGYLWGAWLP